MRLSYDEGKEIIVLENDAGSTAAASPTLSEDDQKRPEIKADIEVFIQDLNPKIDYIKSTERDKLLVAINQLIEGDHIDDSLSQFEQSKNSCIEALVSQRKEEMEYDEYSQEVESYNENIKYFEEIFSKFIAGVKLANMLNNPRNIVGNLNVGVPLSTLLQNIENNATPEEYMNFSTWVDKEGNAQLEDLQKQNDVADRLMKYYSNNYSVLRDCRPNKDIVEGLKRFLTVIKILQDGSPAFKASQAQDFCFFCRKIGMKGDDNVAFQKQAVEKCRHWDSEGGASIWEPKGEEIQWFKSGGLDISTLIGKYSGGFGLESLTNQTYYEESDKLFKDLYENGYQDDLFNQAEFCNESQQAFWRRLGKENFQKLARDYHIDEANVKKVLAVIGSHSDSLVDTSPAAPSSPSSPSSPAASAAPSSPAALDVRTAKGSVQSKEQDAAKNTGSRLSDTAVCNRAVKDVISTGDKRFERLDGLLTDGYTGEAQSRWYTAQEMLRCLSSEITLNESMIIRQQGFERELDQMRGKIMWGYDPLSEPINLLVIKTVRAINADDSISTQKFSNFPELVEKILFFQKNRVITSKVPGLEGLWESVEGIVQADPARAFDIIARVNDFGKSITEEDVAHIQTRVNDFGKSITEEDVAHIQSSLVDVEIDAATHRLVDQIHQHLNRRSSLSLGTITSYIWHGGKSRTERSKAVKDHLKTIIQVDRGIPGNAAILKKCLHGLVDQDGKVRKQITEIKAHLERHYDQSGNKKDQHPNQM